MCILSYVPADAEIDEDGLWNGGVNNPDGHGWAIANGNELIIGKSLELGEALEGFIAARKLRPKSEALFHSRWATHGSIKAANCHPFYVGNSKMTVVAHNGVLPAKAHPAKGDDRSDTRKFADEILSTTYRRLDKARAMDALTRWIGDYNKLVILTVDPRYRHNVYLVNESAGQWDRESGMWHSNGDYLGLPTWLQKYTETTTLGKGTKISRRSAIVNLFNNEEDDRDDCLLCFRGKVNAAMFCTSCRHCQDCFEEMDSCLCYWQGVKERLALEAGRSDTVADDAPAWSTSPYAPLPVEPSDEHMFSDTTGERL